MTAKAIRRRVGWAVALVAALIMTLAVPAAAEPPERTEDALFVVTPDTENGLWLFWNITRQDLCAWVDGGFVGPPPVEKLIPAQFKETGQGAIVTSFQGESSIELWRFDPDVPPTVDPCTDTDEQAAPWATGTARVVGNDNDLDVSLTRMNSFGFHGHATVVDATGQVWRYLFIFRAHISQDGEFMAVVEKANLKTGM